MNHYLALNAGILVINVACTATSLICLRITRKHALRAEASAARAAESLAAVRRISGQAPAW